MENKIKQIDVFKTVKSGTKEVNIFVAFDGKEFNNAKDCSSYEIKLIFDEKVNSLKKKYINGDFYNFPEYYYFASNQEDVETIAKYLEYSQTYDYVYVDTNNKSQLVNDIKIGEWYGQTYEDGGDYRGNVNIYSLSFVESVVKDAYKNFLEYVKQ